MLGHDLTPGSTILVDKKDEEEVSIDIVAGPEPEKVTVPPQEPEAPEQGAG